MTEDELETRWKALAAVNASEAKLALELLKELKELREYRAFTPTARPQETEAVKKVDNARYVLANIAGMVTLATKMGLVPAPGAANRIAQGWTGDHKADFHNEVAAYDAKAKVFYACIVRQFLDLLNERRHSREKMAMPTPEDEIGTGLVEALAELIAGFREINLENDWLRHTYKAVVGTEAPRRPEGWGRSATAGSATKVADVFGRHAAFARDLKARGAEELKAANTTDPEKLAAAATRAANGLPPEADPAVTRRISSDAEKPAGQYEKGSGV